MKSFEYTVTAPEGLHARPAGALVQKAKSYKGRVTVSCGEKKCDAARLMALMGMCIKCGAAVTVTVEGEDEEEFAASLEEFFRENF